MDHTKYTSPKEANKLTAQPSQFQILTSRLKSRLFWKVSSIPDPPTVTREREESLTTECCAISVR